VLFNFLQAGFQKGEGAIYVASQETSTQIRRQMEDFGLNVKTLERDGILRIVDYYDWYIIDGEVNTSHAIASAERVFDEAMEIGLKGLRGCGEVECFFEHKNSFAQEVNFEKFFPSIMDEVLETMFGKIGKKTILRMLDKRNSLTPHKIAEDPSSFIEGLEDLVGSGAQVITKSLVRQMHSKMGITQQK